MEAQERRALLTARKLMETKLHDIELSVRGIQRGFGVKVGKTTPARFAGQIKHPVSGHPHLEAIAESLLTARIAPRREFNRLEQDVRAMGARLLMSCSQPPSPLNLNRL
jgi:transposase